MRSGCQLPTEAENVDREGLGHNLHGLKKSSDLERDGAGATATCAARAQQSVPADRHLLPPRSWGCLLGQTLGICPFATVQSRC